MPDELKPEEKVFNDEYFKKIEKSLDDKIKEQSTKVDSLVASQQQLINALSEKKKPAQKEEAEDDLEHLLINDTKKFVQKIEERADIRHSQRTDGEQRKNNVLLGLVKEFPELNDSNHELYKTAGQIYDSFPMEDRNSALSYQTAVYQAAASHGILPKSKRKQENTDNFQLSGTSQGGGDHKQKKSSKTDSKTLEFANILASVSGRDLSKEKDFEEKLQNIAKNY